jgi:retron-type reverse transcriptase
MLASVVRSTDNLWEAWVAVRANVLASPKSSFRAQVEDISKKPAPFLRRIKQQLETRTFNFAPQKGRVVGKASGGKRALVIAPIASRVVQRAILQVLQSTNPLIVAELGNIPSALRTPTSVGSVPKPPVPMKRAPLSL